MWAASPWRLQSASLETSTVGKLSLIFTVPLGWQHSRPRSQSVPQCRLAYMPVFTVTFGLRENGAPVYWLVPVVGRSQPWSSHSQSMVVKFYLFFLPQNKLLVKEANCSFSLTTFKRLCSTAATCSNQLASESTRLGVLWSECPAGGFIPGAAAVSTVVGQAVMSVSIDQPFVIPQSLA